MPKYNTFAQFPERAKIKRAHLTYTGIEQYQGENELSIVIYDIATAKRMIIQFTAAETKQIDGAINHGVFTEMKELPRHWR